VQLPTVVSSVGFPSTSAVGLVRFNRLVSELLAPDLLAGSFLIMGSVALAAWPMRAGGRP
jgi:hypothetical protein